MEQAPYPHFWSEEPEAQRRAWRPTDEVRRRLGRLWLVQGVLLGVIAFLSVLVARESKRMPPISAKLPNGIVFDTTPEPLAMDRLARMELVNNALQILYYQEGGFNYLGALKQNVKPQLLGQFQEEMQRASRQTNTTVYLNIAETFEAIYIPSKGFDAVTKATLVKRSARESALAPIYIRSRWLLQNKRFWLCAIQEIKPGDYYELFLAEKERLKKLSKEELQRELDVRKNRDIPLPQRKSPL